MLPRIAFLVLAHADPDMLERLCLRLAGHAVFVHVDARAANYPIDRIAALPGVTVVQPRTYVYWADLSMLDAVETMLRAARSAGGFDRYVFISGACYPVKPVAALQAAFAANPSQEWIGLTSITPDSHLHNLIARHWRMRPLPFLDAKLRPLWNRIARLWKRNIQRETGLAPFYGNSWWALSHASITYLLEYLASHPQVDRAYRSVYASDEQMFHTVLGNSQFGARAIPVPDHGAATNLITPLHQVARVGERYFTNTEADFQTAATTDKFFIRKVSTDRSSALLDRIDRELLGITTQAPR